jgi:GAF domain-containing protein
VDVAGNDERDPCEVLLELLGSIALRLSEADTLDATLQRAVDLGEDLMVGCDGVSLMLIGKNGRIDTPAYSTELARDSDQAQYETGQGPCLNAIRDHRTVVIDDLETDQRWPDYRSRALELGIRSTISFRLFVTGDSMGALDMYPANQRRSIAGHNSLARSTPPRHRSRSDRRSSKRDFRPRCSHAT